MPGIPPNAINDLKSRLKGMFKSKSKKTADKPAETDKPAEPTKPIDAKQEEQKPVVAEPVKPVEGAGPELISKPVEGESSEPISKPVEAASPEPISKAVDVEQENPKSVVAEPVKPIEGVSSEPSSTAVATETVEAPAPKADDVPVAPVASPADSTPVEQKKEDSAPIIAPVTTA